MFSAFSCPVCFSGMPGFLMDVCVTVCHQRFNVLSLLIDSESCVVGDGCLTLCVLLWVHYSACVVVGGG